ncbi:hypothetical protein FBD94_16755 [Pedobacter hiemivivus]|uniref:Bacteriophage abortive infection AbiH n=1 Tax=Pedobacter hiemivivus TaxID=2530454 RepID=A0A4U1G5Z4_9SPHI|nr:AbiH family protein [Pedobacter hiemivivus]TKC59181.1 hypothetical protein FBD94_16755 [Pedobacter hiemivivus]
MNRLILLGNGFDLSHGMKTTYNDFILDYMIKCLTEALEKKSYIDEAFKIETGTYIYTFPNSRWESMASLITELYHTHGLKALFHQENFYFGSHGIRNIFKINSKLPFIQHLLENCSCNNWVDIENEYYEKLKSILVNKSSEQKIAKIKELNESLKWLIEKLEVYLSRINHESIGAYDGIVNAPIDKDDFVDQDLYLNQYLQLEAIHILNFNYTSTIEKYIGDIGILDSNIDLNYIHGKLNDINNPIIFGFGDELDVEYTKLEMDKTIGMLDYIKSFGYFKTSNYYNLIRFIDSQNYQVYVIGHSCGLSDRTMLNMIFEHKNCRSIKIFYHQNNTGNNYRALTQEISRHFKDKEKMRRKIVSFNKSLPMPQANN